MTMDAFTSFTSNSTSNETSFIITYDKLRKMSLKRKPEMVVYGKIRRAINCIIKNSLL